MKSTRKTKTSKVTIPDTIVPFEPLPGDPSVPYFAGFFDGEGSVSYESSPCARINNTDLAVLLAFYRRWGGSISRVDSSVKAHRTLYHWTVFGDLAIKFYQDISPYLLEKFPQVDLVFTMRPLPPWQRRPLRKLLTHLKRIDSIEREKELL